MSLKQAMIAVFSAGCLLGLLIVVPGVGYAQEPKAKNAMETLKSKAAKLGSPKVEGTDTVAGKQVPAIYFGSTKQNNDFALVDEVVKEAGGTATIFVKSGDEFVRVATNVKKDDGTRLALKNCPPSSCSTARAGSEVSVNQSRSGQGS